MTDPFALGEQRLVPAAWTVRARRAAAVLEPPGLVRRVATVPVSYNAIMRRPATWRAACAARSLCAIDGCEVTGRLGQIDAVRRIPGAVLDLSATPYAALVAACLACVNE